MKIIFLVFLLGGHIHQECATNRDAAWEAAIDYVMDDIATIESTDIPCETGDL